MTAALESGARRLIAQSLACWVYALGPQPYSENDPLDLSAEGTGAIVVEGVVTPERLTLTSPPLEGVVLRYGSDIRPGNRGDEPAGSGSSPRRRSGPRGVARDQGAQTRIFNIAEDTGYVSIAKARRELGWDPGFRLRNREAAACYQQRRTGRSQGSESCAGMRCPLTTYHGL